MTRALSPNNIVESDSGGQRSRGSDANGENPRHAQCNEDGSTRGGHDGCDLVSTQPIGPQNVQGCSRSREREVADDARLVGRLREQPSWTKPRMFAVCGLYARRLAPETLIVPGGASRGVAASGWAAASWSCGRATGIAEAWRRPAGDTLSVEWRRVAEARAEREGSRRPGSRRVARWGQ